MARMFNWLREILLQVTVSPWCSTVLTVNAHTYSLSNSFYTTFSENDYDLVQKIMQDLAVISYTVFANDDEYIELYFKHNVHDIHKIYWCIVKFK